MPLPNLDTRRWADLVDEGRSLIPRHAPEWTDHNIHDPGITLIELFAWVVDQLIYRTNRIPERHIRKFLSLAVSSDRERVEHLFRLYEATIAPLTAEATS